MKTNEPDNTKEAKWLVSDIFSTVSREYPAIIQSMVSLTCNMSRSYPLKILSNYSSLQFWLLFIFKCATVMGVANYFMNGTILHVKVNTDSTLIFKSHFYLPQSNTEGGFGHTRPIILPMLINADCGLDASWWFYDPSYKSKVCSFFQTTQKKLFKSNPILFIIILFYLLFIYDIRINLLEKLHAIGIRDTTLIWFRSYLSNRTQSVSLSYKRD